MTEYTGSSPGQKPTWYHYLVIWESAPTFLLGNPDQPLLRRTVSTNLNKLSVHSATCTRHGSRSKNPRDSLLLRDQVQCDIQAKLRTEEITWPAVRDIVVCLLTVVHRLKQTATAVTCRGFSGDSTWVWQHLFLLFLGATAQRRPGPHRFWGF